MATVNEDGKRNESAAVIDVADNKTDKQNQEVVLEIRNEIVVGQPDGMDDVEFRGGSVSLRRDRPFSASMVSRRSTKSTQSRVSLSPSLITSDLAAKNLFAYRSGIIDSAVNACKASVVKDLDGDIKGVWLLTEIDHWDLEKEKLILLTSNSLITIKYDFIALAVGKCKRIFLRSIKQLQMGELTYPHYSVMPPRQHGGLRIHWNKLGPSLAQKWNPLCDDLGYVTLTHHLLIYNEKEKETTTFNVEELADSLLDAVNEVRRNDGVSDALSLENGPIVIESYASLSSMVYNQSHLGFNMERGGISF